MRLPRGIPSPSTTTIHFVPFPFLVFPTSRPLFLLGQNFHLKILHHILKDRFYPVYVTELSKLFPKHHSPPSTASVANRYSTMDTCLASLSSAHLTEEPIECLQNILDYFWVSGPHGLVVMAVNILKFHSTARLQAQNLIAWSS